MQALIGYYLQLLYRYRHWLSEKRARGPVIFLLIFLSFLAAPVLAIFFPQIVQDVIRIPFFGVFVVPFVPLGFPFFVATGRATERAFGKDWHHLTETQIREIFERNEKDDRIS